jgi:2-oxoglutarate dehydrogenase E1 component
VTVDPAQVRRVILCSGKVYYDLEARREQLGVRDAAIVRLEQLYPVAPALIEAELARYAPGTPVVWVQEEPENMGAWRFFRTHVKDRLLAGREVHCVSRPESASPATGSANSHKQEQDILLAAAFAARSA